MKYDDEDLKPINTEALFNNPKVMQEAMKQSWEDGNLEGALRFLIRLLKLRGLDSRHIDLKTLQSMQEVGVHLSF